MPVLIPIEDVFGTILFGIFAVALFVITGSLIRHLIIVRNLSASTIHQSALESNGSTKTSIVSICSYACCCLSMFIAFVHICLNDFDDANGIAGYLSSLAYAAYLIGQISALWVYVFRMESFQNTFLEYEQKYIRVLRIGCMAVMVLPIIIILGLAVNLEILVFICAGLWLVLYLALCIALLCMFLNRLSSSLDLVMMASDVAIESSAITTATPTPTPTATADTIADTIAAADKQSSHDKHNELAKQDTVAFRSKLVDVYVRISLLTTISLCSSCLAILIGITMGIIIDGDRVSVWPFINVSIDAMINGTCISLLFSFYKKSYHKMCHKLHRGFTQCRCMIN